MNKLKFISSTLSNLGLNTFRKDVAFLSVSQKWLIFSHSKALSYLFLLLLNVLSIVPESRAQTPTDPCVFPAPCNTMINIANGYGTLVVTGLPPSSLWTGSFQASYTNGGSWVNMVPPRGFTFDNFYLPMMPVNNASFKVRLVLTMKSTGCVRYIPIEVNAASCNCPDGSPRKTPGTACNDNNPNTRNEVIQADGCTCAAPTVCDNLLNGGTVAKVCNNGTVTLTSTSPVTGGSGAVEYIWLKSTLGCPFNIADAIPLAVNADYTIPAGSVTQTTYFARCARRAGCIDWTGSSNCITVTPNECACTPPVITVQPVNITTCSGNLGMMSVTATGTGLSYLWQFSYDGISGWATAQDNGMTTPVLGPHGNDFVYYRVKVSNSCGSVISNVVKQTYNRPTATITGNTNINQCTANTTTLTASGGTSYLWSNSSIQAAVSVGAGNYTVTVTNQFGCKATATKTVISTGLQTPGTACNDNNPNTINDVIQADGCTCAGTPVPKGSIGDMTYCDNNANGVMDNGDTPQSGVQIQLCNASNVIIATATTDAQGKYLFSNLAAGIYVVKFPATITGGKTITTTNPITVNLGAGQNYLDADAGYKPDCTTNPVNATITGANTVCPNTKTILTASGGTSYKWSNGTTTSSITVGAGTYSVTVSNASGCSQTLSKTVSTIQTTLAVSNCPQNITLTAGTNNCAVATWTAPSFTTNCGTPSVLSNYNSGYCFPVGTTTVTYVATINGVSKTCSFTVTVTFTAQGSIGDFTFNDNNNNGIYDTGDSPKSNILVTLCNSAGQTISTTLSVSGKYLFGNLPVGTYIVKFPATHTDGKSLSTPQQITVNLTAGQNFVNADAGYYKPTSTTGSIGDFTFNDNNNNGIYDTGDSPKSNILVTLCNSAGQTISTTLSVSGNYLFGNLPAGTYIVKFPAVHTDGKSLTTPQQITVNLTAGQNFVNADAGYNKPTPTTGSIGDFTFNDNNGNGIYDTGDSPKSNILVTLCNSSGQTISTTLSVSGKYLFGNLPTGTYIVKFPAVHTDGKSLTTPQQITVNLAAGQNYVNADAGYNFTTSPKGSIGDLVFCDNNNNRVYDSGDTPISGVTVTLCNSSNVVITTTTTNSAGNYTFGSLAAGTYIVKFPATLTDGKAITTTNPTTVNLTSGQNYTNADAGYYKSTTGGTSSIKDVFVFCDNNNNQIYDNGDAPIQGVTVTLCNASNQIITTAITDASGSYSFLNLAAGTYIVKFPATLADGKAITTTNPITITLGTGETSSAADAGYYKPATLDCSATRDNSIIRTCSNNMPVLTGTALAGYEYQWLSSTSICPNTPAQAISGATGQNYTLPSAVSQTTYFMRCARPIGCTSWDAVTESNCLTVNLSDCSSSATKCDAVVVKGNTNGTISVTGLGSYTSFVQVFNNQWQSVSNQEYNQPSVSIPLKNGAYSVNVLLYDANSGGWIFLCEKTVSVIVSGGLNALSKNTILDINAFAEAQRAQIQWVNNTGNQNDFFTVEKLNNTSGNFEKIETVNSKSTEVNEVYNVYDNAITEGANTYRVLLTMLDGQVKTSALKTLTYKNLNDIRIYPNPASDYIEVDLKQYEGKKVTLYIYNQVGKLVHTQQIERASATPIHLDMDKQTNGQMLLRVTAEGHREVTKKFVIHN